MTSIASERPPLRLPFATSGRLRGLLEREAQPIAAVSVWVALLALWLPGLLVPDSWLALVDGRLIAEHGLPHADTLTAWMYGRPWTDQQWGAQWLLYEVVSHGGVVTALGLAIGILAAALGLAGLASRTLGGSSRSTALALMLPVIAAPWMAQLRTQTLALIPFVAVYSLLAFDARRPSRRVLFVLPLLAVWANLHGSVILAAGLVVLHGLWLAVRGRRRLHGALLACAAPLCVFASPYGLQLAAYYRLMLVHPPFANMIVEWRPASLGSLSFAFFASAFLLTTLGGSHFRALNAFERWALPILLLAALTAMRNAIWFELALAVSLPRLIDAAWPSQVEATATMRRVNVIVSSAAVTVAALALGLSLAGASGVVDREFPPAGATAVAAAAGPGGVVLAADEQADWLLWQQPQLAGRVAYDVRFELFDAHEMSQIILLHDAVPSVWARCGSTARVVTFASSDKLREAFREHVLAPGSHTIFENPALTAVAQPEAAHRRCVL